MQSVMRIHLMKMHEGISKLHVFRLHLVHCFVVPYFV